MAYKKDFKVTHVSPHSMSQIYFIEDVFREYFAKAIIPDRIIELGTANGEFGRMIFRLRSAINNDFDYYSFDIKQQFDELPPELNFKELDVFKHIEYIGGLIKERTLILCDNGDKPREVRLLTPFLKQDCVIMAHDYFPDEATFYSTDTWVACEIMNSDVADLGLTPYLPDIMTRGIWLSLIKK